MYSEGNLSFSTFHYHFEPDKGFNPTRKLLALFIIVVTLAQVPVIDYESKQQCVPEEIS
jgi:hypothetical protein